MKLTVQHVHIRSTDSLDSLVEERIMALESQLRIEEARVRLECRFEESPSFRVAVHLVVPGPDLAAEGKDHTIRAAVVRAMTRLEEQISRRANSARRNVLSKRSVPRTLGVAKQRAWR